MSIGKPIIMALTPNDPPNSNLGCSSTFGSDATLDFLGRPRPCFVVPLAVPLELAFASPFEGYSGASSFVSWPLAFSGEGEDEDEGEDESDRESVSRTMDCREDRRKEPEVSRESFFLWVDMRRNVKTKAFTIQRMKNAS